MLPPLGLRQSAQDIFERRGILQPSKLEEDDFHRHLGKRGELQLR